MSERTEMELVRVLRAIARHDWDTCGHLAPKACVEELQTMALSAVHAHAPKPYAEGDPEPCDMCGLHARVLWRWCKACGDSKGHTLGLLDAARGASRRARSDLDVASRKLQVASHTLKMVVHEEKARLRDLEEHCAEQARRLGGAPEEQSDG